MPAPAAIRAAFEKFFSQITIVVEEKREAEKKGSQDRSEGGCRRQAGREIERQKVAAKKPAKKSAARGAAKEKA